MMILQPVPSLACAAPDTCGSRLAGDADPATCPIPVLCCTRYLWEPACRRCLPCNPPHPWQASSHQACTAPDTCGSRLTGDADPAPSPSLASQLPQGLHCTHYLWEPAAGDDDPATCPIPGLHCTALHLLSVGAGLPAMLTLQPAPSLACTALHCTQYLWEPACRRCGLCNLPHPWPALHPISVGAGLPAMLTLQPAPSLASQLPQGLHCTHYLWEPAAGDADSATCPIPGLRCTRYLWEPASRRC